MLSTLSTASYLAHTVFATAHLHFLMMAGVLTALLAGLHYWWPLMFGRMYNQLLGRLSGLAKLPAGMAGLDTIATIGMWILTTGLVMVCCRTCTALCTTAAAGPGFRLGPCPHRCCPRGAKCRGPASCAGATITKPRH